MREIEESDWRVLRQLHSIGLERFYKQILLQVEGINRDGARSFHQKYLDVYEVLQRRNKETAETFDGLRRPRAFVQLASMKERGLLSEEDLLRFGQETQNAVDRLFGNRPTTPK